MSDAPLAYDKEELQTVKNLFCIDRTEDALNNRADTTPFHAEHIKEDLDEKLKQASAAAFEAFSQSGEESNTPRPARNGSWQLGLGLLLALGAVIPTIIWHDRLFADGNTYLAWILLGMLLAGGVLVSIAYRAQRKAMAQERLERQERNSSAETTSSIQAAMERLDRLQRQARSQLRVPDYALELDILPATYRRKGNERICLDKLGHFDNQIMLAWCQGKELCLSDGLCTLRIPTDAIKGYITYDKPFRVSMWLHSQRPDEGRFKSYHLKQNGFLSVRGHTVYGIRLASPDGNSYELRIPAYDLPQLEKLVTLPGSDTSAESW